jgi:hypothetical protein
MLRIDILRKLPFDRVEPLAARPLVPQLAWALRLGVAGEFVGHGWVGTGRPAAWLPFFQVFGFSSDFANAVMPVIGAWDIGVGLLMLAVPMRWLLIWTAVWGLFTAFLRPLAGQGWWEFLERGGNYGVPLALLLLAGVHAYTQSVWNWLRPMRPRPTVSPAQAQRLAWVLRLTVASLLIGHGGIGAFMHREAWTAYFTVLGINAATVGDRSLIETVGWLEIAMGIVVLFRPFRGLLLFVFCWKVFTELLRPLAGEEIGQFIERFGGYAAPIALALLVTSLRRSTGEDSTSIGGPAQCSGQETSRSAPPSLRSGTPTTPGRQSAGTSAQVPVLAGWVDARRDSEVQGGPVDELLDVAVERPALDQLEVEVRPTLEDRV